VISETGFTFKVFVSLPVKWIIRSTIGWSARKVFHVSHISTVEKKCAVCFQEGNLWKRPLSLSLQLHAFHFGKERNYLMAEFRRRH